MDIGLIVDADEIIGQGISFRNEDLGTHDIHTGNHFRNGVFHLDTGIHLDEVVIAVTIHQKFQCAGGDIVHMLCDLHRITVQCLTGLLRNREGRSEFHDLLIASLQRAVALTQMHHVAVFVTQHLDLDVFRIHQELLHEDIIIAEGLLRFALDEIELDAHIFLTVTAAHTASAAAGSRFQNDRKTEFIGNLHGFVGILDGLFRTGDRGDLTGPCDLLCFQFVAHLRQDLGRRTDEGDACIFTCLGKCGILGQESVTRMNGTDAAPFGKVDDGRNIQICLQRALVLADEVRFVRLHAEQRVDVLIGIHRHRIDAQIVAGAENTDRDLTAVGGKDFVECRRLHVFNHPIFHGFFYIFNNRCK